MGEVGGFISKYERAEVAEMATASLAELEALEKKYSEVLEGGQYAFSKNAEEEGHKIFSRLLVTVRAKIAEAKLENKAVKTESWKRRTALSEEVKGRKKERTPPARTETAKPETEPRRPEAPETAFRKIPIAPEPVKPAMAETKKVGVDGFAGWVRWALKDMGDSASKIFGASK